MLGFVILAALGLAFLVLPIFMQRGGQGFDARGDSTSRWYRSRLAELEDDAADPEVREEIKPSWAPYFWRTCLQTLRRWTQRRPRGNWQTLIAVKMPMPLGANF